MASQIEQTLASLTALSQRYTTQLDQFFVSNDAWFQDFRATTLTSFKNALQRIESRALLSRSPAKSLNKKNRRKPKKVTRTRKKRSKPRAPTPRFSDSVPNSEVDDGTTTKFFASPLGQKLCQQDDGFRPEQKSALSDAPQLQSTLAKPPVLEEHELQHDASPTKHVSLKRVSSKRLTRSTSSFQSAVQSPVTDNHCADDLQGHERPNSPNIGLCHSPEVSESQWEDCRPELEPARIHCSKGSTADTKMETGGTGVHGREAPKADTKSEPAPHVQEKESSLTPSSSHDAEGQPPKEGSRGTTNGIFKRSNGERIDPVKITDNHNRMTCERTKTVSSEPQRIHDACTDDEEGNLACSRGQSGSARSTRLRSSHTEKDGKSKENRTKLYRDLATDKVGRSSEVPKDACNDKTNPSEKPAREDFPSTKEARGRSSLGTNECRKESIEDVDFEFKEPKPRLITNRVFCGSQPSTFSRQVPDIQETPTSQVKGNPQSLLSQESVVLQKRFKVDEVGKINDDGIGLLSEIASTPATVSKGSETGVFKDGEERNLRGTKLFKPPKDIYSAQRKPTLSRVLSVQKSNMTSRASVISHTPGAHAPTTRLVNHPVVVGPSNTSLRESIAALKQPITESKSMLLKPERGSNEERTRKGQVQSPLQSHESDVRTLTGKKRLTFADGFKQLDQTSTSSGRVVEPQTAPAKENRHPRIRREMEKSALRRRIEEIRSKASTLTDASPHSSADENMLQSSSEQETGSNKTNDKASEIRPREKQTEKYKNMSMFRGDAEDLVYVSARPADEVERAIQSDGCARGEAFDREGSLLQSSHRQELPCAVQQPVQCDAVLGRGTNTDRRSTCNTEGSTTKEFESSSDELKAETEGETAAPKNLLSNLMSSVSSLYPAASSLLGVRTHDERREETDAEVAAKRQRLDAERREAERLARMEAQRAARQKEAEEKQRRAEVRRQLLAEAEKVKEDERKRKEEHRRKVKQQEEEQRRRKKLEDDKKKEERRRQVLEKRAMNMEMQSKRKGHDGKRQRHVKLAERSVTGIPKPTVLGGKIGKPFSAVRALGKLQSPTSDCKPVELETGLVTATKKCARTGDEDEREPGVTSYSMTPAKSTVIEESDEETERRRGKVIPQWAGERNLTISTRSQPDPDKVFVNMPMCNLRDVFGTTKQYRTRSSSANWTQDRVTTAEMTKYKKAVGGFRDA